MIWMGMFSPVRKRLKEGEERAMTHRGLFALIMAVACLMSAVPTTHADDDKKRKREEFKREFLAPVLQGFRQYLDQERRRRAYEDRRPQKRLRPQASPEQLRQQETLRQQRETLRQQREAIEREKAALRNQQRGQGYSFRQPPSPPPGFP